MIVICYFVEFEKSDQGGWIWKWIGNDEDTATNIFVSKTISYTELYDEVRKAVKVDPIIYDIEMKFLVPGMAKLFVPPMKITCDMDVSWFLSLHDQVPICVTLVENGYGDLQDMELDTVNIQENHEYNSKSVVDNVEDMDELNMQKEKSDDNYMQPLSPFNQICENDCVNFTSDDYWDGVEVVHDNYIDDSHVINEDNVTHNTPFTLVNEIIGISQVVACPNPCGTSVKIPDAKNVHVSQIFHNKKDLQAKLQMLAVRNSFEFKVTKSNKSTYVVVCVEKICKWRLRAVRLKESDEFEIRKYSRYHNCSLDVRHKDHKQASCWMIGKHIMSKFEDPNIIYRPSNIQNDIRREFGIDINYYKAWMARECALELLRGSPELSYDRLAKYCNILKKNNPSTVTFIEVDNENRFKYFFMALGPSIMVFTHQ